MATYEVQAFCLKWPQGEWPMWALDYMSTGHIAFTGGAWQIQVGPDQRINAKPTDYVVRKQSGALMTMSATVFEVMAAKTRE